MRKPICLVLLGLLTACMDSSTPRISIDSLPAGSYTVSMGEAESPTVGQYFATSTGERLLLVQNDELQSQVLYRSNDGTVWKRVPSSGQDSIVHFLRSESLGLDDSSLASLAGQYSVLVDGSAVALTVDKQGVISPASASGCQLAGKVASTELAGFYSLSISSSACTSLPTSLSGRLIVDSADSPARLRMVLDNGSQLTELWAYAE